ncbi:glycosyltransferase [Motilibacter aurantiacus]|uniref:glycosyltransferase n=1 Tax=Motilibacter aurantiacus TaxID=2714955 RepID=UPI0014094008|nr:glycosyltransferase family A protein [Motilibacter aurantiacus]NHC45124.1 glycosyltransferase family 2 protein [Motilibacter aurantiacus]
MFPGDAALPRPALTVVIPAFDAEAYVEQSVRSALAQESVDVSVVVVDDGSADRTAAVVAGIGDPRARLLRQANAGPGAARDAGARAAATAYVAFLDADDVLLPGWAAAVCAALDAGATVAVTDAFVFCGDERAELTYYQELPFPHEDQAAQILRYNFVLTTAAVRRDALLQVGGYSAAGVGVAEDWALWQALLLAGGSVALVPRVLSGYRRGHASLSSRVERMKADEIRLLRRRRRQVRHDRALSRAAREGLRVLRGDRAIHRVRRLAPAAPRRAALAATAAAWYFPHRRHAKAAVLLALAPERGRRYVATRI